MIHCRSDGGRARPNGFALRGICALAVVLLVGAGLPHALDAQAATQSATATRLYQEVGSRVLKVELIEIESDAPSSVGTGFFVTESGAFVTNFHVVSDAVYEPERYSIRLVGSDEESRSGRVIAVDPVHDLAVLSTEYDDDGVFDLRSVDVSQGDPLFSLGHPLDLDLSIVEGIYNGLLRNALYPRIHFTGSVNPGMSGGPAVDDQGRVVGVNVATAGNQLSFLVPASFAVELLQEALERDMEPEPDFLEAIEDRMMAHQETYLERVGEDSFPPVRIGGFEAPSNPAPFFDCASTVLDLGDIEAEAVRHDCFTQDQIFLSNDRIFDVVDLTHIQLRSDSLSTLQFLTLYRSYWSNTFFQVRFGGDDTTDYRCEDGRVDNEYHTLVTLFCARRYTDFPNLYDVFVRSVTVDGGRSGLASFLTMNGVGMDEARDLARLFLERIR